MLPCSYIIFLTASFQISAVDGDGKQSVNSATVVLDIGE